MRKVSVTLILLSILLLVLASQVNLDTIASGINNYYGSVRYSSSDAKSEKEIREWYSSHRFSLEGKWAYSRKPNKKLGVAGRLSSDSVREALDTTNLLRYSVGLPLVENSSRMGEYAMNSAILLNELGYVTHTPRYPVGLDKGIYRKGKYGSSNGNIGYNGSNIPEFILGCICDEDEINISHLGHRMWLLGNITRVGFGAYGKCKVEMVNHNNNGECFIGDYLAFPCKNTPFKLLWCRTSHRTGYVDSYPWLIVLGHDWKLVDKDRVVVRLDSLSTGQSWKFSLSDSSWDGNYMNIGKGSYGFWEYGGPDTIIFRPKIGENKIRAGNRYRVTVKGLECRGKVKDLVYDVNIFHM